MPITWKNVAAPNPNASNALAITAARSIGGAFQQGADNLQTAHDRKSERMTGQAIAQLYGLNDRESYADQASAILRGQDNRYVNMGELAKSSSDRMDNLQNRALTELNIGSGEFKNSVMQDVHNMEMQKGRASIASSAASARSSDATTEHQKWTRGKEGRDRDKEMDVNKKISGYRAQATYPDVEGGPDVYHKQDFVSLVDMDPSLSQIQGETSQDAFLKNSGQDRVEALTLAEAEAAITKKTALEKEQRDISLKQREARVEDYKTSLAGDSNADAFVTSVFKEKGMINDDLGDVKKAELMNLYSQFSKSLPKDTLEKIMRSGRGSATGYANIPLIRKNLAQAALMQKRVLKGLENDLYNPHTATQ